MRELNQGSFLTKHISNKAPLIIKGIMHSIKLNFLLMKKRDFSLILAISLLLLLMSCQFLPLGWAQYNYDGIKKDFTAREMVGLGKDIWIRAFTYNGDIEIPLLFRFTPQTQTLKAYAVEFVDGTAVPQQLYITKKGELWGAGILYNSPDYMNRLSTNCQLNPNQWLLTHYDKEKDRFLVIEDKDKILQGCRVLSITEDGRGDLWLNVVTHGDNHTFRYDPLTNEAVEIDLIKKIDVTTPINEIENIIGGPDGALWISVIRSGEKSPQKASTILRYDPVTERINDYGCPSSGCMSTALLFDSFGHLWISSVAWLDWNIDKPLWHEGPRDLFMAKIEPDWQPDFMEPSQIFQSSDGRIWFTLRYQNGLVVFDFQDNTWKKILFNGKKTIYDIFSSITESNGYIWIVQQGNFIRKKVGQ